MGKHVYFGTLHAHSSKISLPLFVFFFSKFFFAEPWIKFNSWNLETALRYVKEKRPIADPNDGFLKQLITYEGILSAAGHRQCFFGEEEKHNSDESDTDIDIGSELIR